LDLRGLDLNGDRPYQLHHYRVRAEVASAEFLETLPDWKPSRGGRLRSALQGLGWPLRGHRAFWPQSFAYDPRFEMLRQPVYLIGYWQSERYFAEHRTPLLADLTLHETLSDSLQHWVSLVTSCESVALHIRRGDYVSNPAARQFHGLCDPAYYQRAMQELMRAHPKSEVFVFSDEPEWVKANFKLDAPMHVVDAHHAEQAHLDLEIMRHCRHHVLANSSFSWWGAWLGQHPEQKVFAPVRWFADPSVNTSDVIPSRWARR